MEKARRLQPKAIFLNPLLPLLSGWDVLTLLKSDGATKHIPVMVTATGGEKEQAFAHGADGFLSLPVETPALLPLLEKLCGGLKTQEESSEHHKINIIRNPLRILRLVEPHLESINPHPSLQEHRVIEVDDLDQAELLARVWQFDVILLDVKTSIAPTYLQELAQHPSLANLPLVTCDVATTLAASQIPGLSVFPYLTPLTENHNPHTCETEALLSVLQIASGVCCPPNILVVDTAKLQPPPTTKRKQVNNPSISSDITQRGSEWFQALIQYLQTAGLQAAMGQELSEILQQIRHQSVDLLLICLGDAPMPKNVLKELKALNNLPINLPPILAIDQGLNNNHHHSYPKLHIVEDLIQACKIHQVLPRSISMEDLLHEINQALATKG